MHVAQGELASCLDSIDLLMLWRQSVFPGTVLWFYDLKHQEKQLPSI